MAVLSSASKSIVPLPPSFARQCPADFDAPSVLFPNDAVGQARRVILSTPSLRSHVAQAMALIEPDFYPPQSPHSQKTCFSFVPFMQHDENRALMSGAVNQALRERSVRLHATLAAQPYSNVWDVVVIGAGPHGAALANVLRRTQLRVLVIEATDRCAPGFSHGGHTFQLDSANGGREGVASAAHCNNTPLGGPIEIPYICGARWPDASYVSDAVAANLYSTDVDVMMQTQVGPLKHHALDGYTFTVTDAQGAMNAVRAQHVVIATGLGKATFRCADAGTMQLVMQQAGAFSDVDMPSGVAPGVMFADQAWRFLQVSKTGRDAFRAPCANEVTTVVVGFGSSAKVFLQYLFGTRFQRYGTDCAQRGNIGKVVWLVGGRAARSSTYLEEIRARYQDLMSPINKGLIELRAGELVQIEPRGEHFGLVYRYAGDVDSRLQARRVVLATGYESTLHELLRDVMPPESVGRHPEYSADFTLLRTAEFSPIAKRLNDEEIYLAGPAAGADLVPDAELQGPPESRPAMRNTMPRTLRFAQALASAPPHAAARRPTLPRIPTPAVDIRTAGCGSPIIVLPVRRPAQAIAALPNTPAAQLRWHVLTLLTQLNVCMTQRLTLIFRCKGDAVTWETRQLSAADCERLAALVDADEGFRALLHGYLTHALAGRWVFKG